MCAASLVSSPGFTTHLHQVLKRVGHALVHSKEVPYTAVSVRVQVSIDRTSVTEQDVYG